MLAITGGEPMVQHAFIASGCRVSAPRPCMLETNAMVTAGLDSVLPHVAARVGGHQIAFEQRERALWDEHRRFLTACRETDVYVKMPVDERTDPEEVRRGARLVRETCRTRHCSCSRLPRARHCVGDVAERLLELVGCAQSEMPRTELRPQLHKLMGLR